jgi:lipopolysaccharide/colanic/teichoic acid biosynthesis glycosyltransferase
VDVPHPPEEDAPTGSLEVVRLGTAPIDSPRTVDAVLRALDLAIAGLAFALLSPLLAAFALLILVTSGRPVLYRGARVGRGGRPFTMVKLRTLRPDAEARLGTAYGHDLSIRTELEVTRVGRWLRASQLDEVPQLWNVVCGHMSLVGPRPIRPALLQAVVAEYPEYWQRLAVRPGLSGFAQTRMGREEAWSEKLAHDLEYIADRSVRLYLRVVLGTAWRLLCQAAAGLNELVLRRPRPTAPH